MENKLKEVFESSSRVKHNPIDMIKYFWPDITENEMSHITYDPAMKDGERDYFRIEGCGGDGTSIFTDEMIIKSLSRLLDKNSTPINTPPDKTRLLKDIHYTIGTMRHATVYGMIRLKCSKDHLYPGQKERVRFPVKCTYIYN